MQNLEFNINFFRAQLNWTRNFNCSYRQIKKFIASSLSYDVFIMLIHVKMLTIANNCWPFKIYEQDNFRAQLS